MTVRASFYCDGRNCAEGVSIEVLALGADVAQMADQLRTEGWSLMPHQRENRVRVLCPRCVAKKREHAPGIARCSR
jgi:hypothetical protein